MCSIKPVIECGPDGIIFPMVNTAEQARQCVSHCTYPLKGTRGFGPLHGLDKNARGEVESLIALENYVRKQLDI